MATRPDGTDYSLVKDHLQKPDQTVGLFVIYALMTHNSVMDSHLLSRITHESGKCGGKPCIRGMRIRASDILELLGAGASIEEILRDYDFLERDDILAAILYAAQQTDHIVLKTA